MLSVVQQRKLRRAFSLYDADHDGYISQADFDTIAQRYAAQRGWATGTPEYAALEAEFVGSWGRARAFADADHDDRLNADEWLGMIEWLIHDTDQLNRMLTPIAAVMFDALDRNGDGSLTLDEYAPMLRNYGEGSPADLFARLDTDGDGQISKDDFAQLYHDFLYSEDLNAPGSWLLGAF